MTGVYSLSVTPAHVVVMYHGYHDISEHMEGYLPGAPLHTHMNRYSHRLKLQDVKKLGMYGDFGKENAILLAHC